jgi:hypothetical protein
MFRGVVHFEPVDQVFLDPVAPEVGMFLLDVCDGLIEIESLSIGPDEAALPGVELYVLHEITERIGELGKLLPFGRMPPLEEIIEEGIIREDTVSPVIRILFAPIAHELFSLRSEPSNAVSSRHSADDDFPTKSPYAGVLERLAIMSTGMVNEL